MERLDPEPGVIRVSPVLRLGVGSSPKVLSQSHEGWVQAGFFPPKSELSSLPSMALLLQRETTLE